jgi:hypothetical protein
MRSLLLICALAASLCVLGGCSSGDETATTTRTTTNTTTGTTTNTTSNTTSSTTTPNSSRVAPASDGPPVSAAHRTGLPADAPNGAGVSSNSSNASAPDKSEIDTAPLDAKISLAEAKAKASGASAADKRAAAEAYFERGYKYYSAQNPKLYRFALGDFRRVLRYQPDHAEARQIIEQIEGIYRSMGRPIPTNGLEQ